MGSNFPSYQGKGKYRPSITSSSKRPGRTKRLNALAHDDPELAAQRAVDRTEEINAKSFRRGRQTTKQQDPDYLAAVAEFADEEDCSPVESVPLNPRCIDIARQFDKTPEEVAKDINRVYLASYAQF